MKIKTYGYRGITDQITRIEEGFVKLGHEIINDIHDADIIYINDRTFEDISVLVNTNGKKIFNVLDIPIFALTKSDLNKWGFFLNHADVVTCISNTVRDDIKKYFNINAKTIYNPSKDVFHIKKEDKIPRMLFVGRANEPTKRFNLIKSFFKYYNLDEKKILNVCGTENPNFGNYCGILSDEELNKQYNSCDVVLSPSSFEGLGLPMIEAIICKKMPICCKDNITAHEFLPDWFLCDPNISSINEKIRDYYKIRDKYDIVIEKLSEEYKKQFNKAEIAKNILRLV